MSTPALQARRFASATLLVAVIAVVVIVRSPGAGGHQLWVTVDDATGVLAGQQLREAGQPIGEIDAVLPVDGGRRARLGFEVDDADWPLTRGTTMRLRWGGTISYLQRYVEVFAGPPRAAAYADGATVPSAAFQAPVEFDTLIDDFGPRLRGSLHQMLTNAGDAMWAARAPLRDTVQRAPGAVEQAGALLADADSVRSQLTALVSSSAQVVGAIRQADPSIEQAATGAGETLTALASESGSLQATIGEAAGTFNHIRSTLHHVDPTIDLATSLSARLTPGIRELRQTVTPLDRLLQTITTVGPTAVTTLDTARGSAPQVTSLLTRSTELMPEISSIFGQALPQLGCIRPYTPDIAAFFTDWNRFWDYNDGSNYYARVAPAAIAWAPTNASTYTPAQAAKLFPELQDQFPRPPGTNAGQPWFQPQCGAGPSALNPNNDPEARPGSTIALRTTQMGSSR
jgi:ABC-type transporter Mla subunit MlaD